MLYSPIQIIYVDGTKNCVYWMNFICTSVFDFIFHRQDNMKKKIGYKEFYY